MKSIFTLFALAVVISFSKAAAQTNAPNLNSTIPVTQASDATTGQNAAVAKTEPTGDVVHKALLFRPPVVASGSALPIRVGGGSRGENGSDILVEVLVPDKIALTTQAQPSLYWYQSKEAKTRCEVSITEPKNPKPLLMLKADAPTPEGIHAIRLSKFSVKLKPNVVYRWSVAVIVDPENRSQDIIANGYIERNDPSPDLAAKLAAASDGDKAAIYAENGMWYDALQSVSDQIDLDPKNASLREERASLLKQVGIDGGKMDDLLAKQ